MIAGTVSTVLFAGANLPMLLKAIRTRDLSSYSLGNLAIGNVANVIHSVYVVSLPIGPIWALHGFYLVSMGAMLALYVRYRAPRPAREEAAEAPIASDYAAAG